MKKSSVKMGLCVSLIISLMLSIGVITPITATAKPKVKSITLNKKRITIIVGKSKKLKATVKPANLAKKLKWRSSEKDIVTVSKKGKLVGKRAGNEIVTAFIGNKKARCRVIVKNKAKKLNDTYYYYESSITGEFISINYKHYYKFSRNGKVVWRTEKGGRIKGSYTIEGNRVDISFGSSTTYPYYLSNKNNRIKYGNGIFVNQTYINEKGL